MTKIVIWTHSNQVQIFINQKKVPGKLEKNQHHFEFLMS